MPKKPEFFLIYGYWNDSRAEINGYRVTNVGTDHPFSDAIDDTIFFYGLDETELQRMVDMGEGYGGDFTVIEFERE